MADFIQPISRRVYHQSRRLLRAYEHRRQVIQVYDTELYPLEDMDSLVKEETTVRVFYVVWKPVFIWYDAYNVVYGIKQTIRHFHEWKCLNPILPEEGDPGSE